MSCANLVAAAMMASAISTSSPDGAAGQATSYRRVEVDGVGIFYREAGPRDAPTVVLLHGYPSSSRMYEPLIQRLSDRYHLIAPDYPGFGHSDTPKPDRYSYTFDHLAESTAGLLKLLKINNYVLFMQDYGGPVGFRIAARYPQKVRAIVVQNANVYQEGLGAKWRAIANYWTDRDAHPEQVDTFMSLVAARQRHTGESPNLDKYDPDLWTDEYAALSRPGQREIQAALLYDYRTNVASYPIWQAWLRKHQPPTLVLWGKYDPSFITPGATAFSRDVPDAEIHLLDAGHFALDEKADEVAKLVGDFLDRHSGALAAAVVDR